MINLLPFAGTDAQKSASNSLYKYHNTLGYSSEYYWGYNAMSVHSMFAKSATVILDKILRLHKIINDVVWLEGIEHALSVIAVNSPNERRFWGKFFFQNFCNPLNIQHVYAFFSFFFLWKITLNHICNIFA